MPSKEVFRVPEAERAIQPLDDNFSNFMRMVKDRARLRRTEETVGTHEQDGGAEIHPDLVGVTFKFWVADDSRCAVNFKGSAPKAPWATHLTGKIFANAGDAKAWLRQQAEKLSAAEKNKNI